MDETFKHLSDDKRKEYNSAKFSEHLYTQGKTTDSSKNFGFASENVLADKMMQDIFDYTRTFTLSSVLKRG